MLKVQIDFTASATELTSIEGNWIKNVSAGGANPGRNSFGANPQFHITLEDTDDDDVLASAIISLTQHNNKEDDIAIGMLNSSNYANL